MTQSFVAVVVCLLLSYGAFTLPIYGSNLYCVLELVKLVEKQPPYLHVTSKFFEQTLFRHLFSSYMYVEKAAKTMFVPKICT